MNDDLQPPDDLIVPPDDLVTEGPSSIEDAFPDAIRYAEHTKPGQVSPKGARSPMQVLPSTAKNPGYGITPAKDDSEEEHARVGRDYSKALLKEYKSPALAGMAYNAGPGQLDEWLKKFGDPRTGAISEPDFIGKVPYPGVRQYAADVTKAMPPQAEQPPDDLIVPPDDLVVEAGPGETPAAAAPTASKGVLSNGMLPNHQPTLDPAKAGDNWTTVELSEEGIPKHYVLPTKPDDNNTPNDDTGFMGDAVERFKKTGQHYGAFDTDEAGAAFMQGSARPTHPGILANAPAALRAAMPQGVAPGISTPDTGTQPVLNAFIKGIARADQESKYSIALITQGSSAAPIDDEDQFLSQPLTKGPWQAIPQKLAYGLAKTAPETTSAILGGIAGGRFGPAGAVTGTVAGAALGTGLQSIAGHFAEELKVTPDDPSGAYKRAWAATGEDAAKSGISWAMFAIAPFEGAIKNLLFQGLVVQPATSGTLQEVSNLLHGRPEMEGVYEAAAETAVQTPVMLGAHAVTSALARSPRTGGASGAGEAAQEPPPGPGAPGEPPPAGAPHGVGPGGGILPERPGRDFGQGEVVSIMPPGSPEPYDVAILGTSEDGKTVTVQTDDGRKKDVPADWLSKFELPEAPSDLVDEEGEPLAPNAGDRLVPEEGGAPSTKAPIGFTTAKGSVYTFDPDAGTTTRDKASRPEHPGKHERGPQPISEQTIFVTPEDAEKLGEFQAQGGPGDKIIAPHSDGVRWGVQYTSGSGAGKFERRTMVVPHLSPDVGLIPVEIWKGGKKVHFGNAITELQGQTEPRGTADKPVLAPQTDADLDAARAQAEPPKSAEQAHAGNYSKGHIANHHGMDIAMETPKGAERSGTSPTGEDWSNVNPVADYGEIKGSKGADGEPVDIYLGPNPKSEKAYIIDQVDPKTGKFDEHKVVADVDSPQQAAEVYNEGFSDGSGPERMRSMQEMPVAELKDWATSPAALKTAESAPPGINVTSQVKDVAAPTTRGLDDNKNPIFNEGERVVIADGMLAGRHGTVSKRNDMVVQPMFGGNRANTSNYLVETDEGHVITATKLAEETEKPKGVVKDPVIDGIPMSPDHVQASIAYALKRAKELEDIATRTRGLSKGRLQGQAKEQRAKAERLKKTIDAWAKKSPETFPAGTEVPTRDIEPPPVPQPPGTKATVTENEAKNGVEVRFTGRPDDAVLGRLKAGGFKWSKGQRLWYATRKPATLALAKELAGEKPAPAAEAPILATPEPSATPSKQNLDVASGAAHEREMQDIDHQVTVAALKKRAATPVGTLPRGILPEWTEIGVNSGGHPLFEDQRGVRSYTADGIRRTEPVAIIPTAGGLQFSVDRAPNDPEFEPVSPSQRIGQQAMEEGARAEFDASVYQPGGMPAAGPDPEKVSDYARGDEVVIRPENRDIAPARDPTRVVVDVSQDGSKLTLDGGQPVDHDDVRPAQQSDKVANGLVSEPLPAGVKVLRQQINKLEKELQPIKTYSTVAEVDRALAENQADFNARRISHADFADTKSMLENRRLKIMEEEAAPPPSDEPQYSRLWPFGKSQEDAPGAPMPAQPAQSTEQVGIGADLKRLIDLYGPKMYGSSMPQVTAKELLQNSFDGVKSALKRGDLKPGEGRVSIDLNRVERTLTVTDNGSGMSPETVKNAFLTIAGTDKGDLAESERSGGFGVAKLAFIFGNEELHLSTVRDGVKTTLDSTGHDLLDGKANLHVEPDSRPNGTRVVIKFPATLRNNWSGEMEPTDLGNSWRDAPFFHILEHPLIGDVEVSYGVQDQYDKPPKRKILPIGRNLDLSAKPKVTTAHFPWGDIDVYMAKDRFKGSYPPHAVLSSGLFQFNSGIPVAAFSQDMIPYEIIMDVRPRVEASDAQYPFDNQREGWSKKIGRDIDQLKGFLQHKYAAESARGLGGSFADSKLMPVSRGGETSPGAFEFADADLKRHVPGVSAVEIEPDIEIRNGKTLVGGKETDALERLKEASKFTPKNFKFNPRDVPSGLPYYHDNLNVDLIAEAQVRYGIPEVDSRRFFAGVGTIILDFRAALAKVDTGSGRDYSKWDEPGQVVGVSIDKNYHGVHIRVPFQGMFINPLSVLTKTPEAQAAEILETMFHEAAHTFVTNHEEAFTSEMHRLSGAFSEANPRLARALQDRLENHIIEHQAAFDALKGIYNDQNTENAPRVAKDPDGSPAHSASAPRLFGRPFGVREGEQLAEAVRESRARSISSGDGRGVLRGSDDGGLDPQYSRRRPPKDVDDAVGDMDATAAGIGHNLPPSDIDRFSADIADEFPKGTERPSRHLSKSVWGSLQRMYYFPRVLAANDWRSAKYWQALQVKDDEARRLLHAAAEGSVKYTALTPVQRGRLHAVEELMRLKGQTLPEDGNLITVTNNHGISPETFAALPQRLMIARLTDFGIMRPEAEAIVDRIVKGDAATLRRALEQMNPPMEHSKFGDEIALDRQTTDAYWERRELFRQRWRELMRGYARSKGWEGSINPKDIRAAAELEDRQAGKTRLEGLASLLEAMGEQERAGYVPLQRFGDYYIWVQPKAGHDPASLGGFPRTVNFQMVESKPPFAGIFTGTKVNEKETPKAAQAAIDELRKRYPESAYNIGHGYVQPNQLRDIDIPALDKLLTALDQKDPTLYEGLVTELEAKLYEELKAGFKKQASNVPGYSSDFARATGNYFNWTSHHIATQVHGEAVRDTYERYIANHPDWKGKNNTRRFWEDYNHDQGSPGSLRKLQAFGFYWEMAANPSSSVSMFLHGPLLASTTLGIGLGASKAGFAKASKYLYPAIAQAITGFHADTSEGMGIKVANIKGISNAERAGLDHADKIGLLHSTLTDELYGMRVGNYDQRTEAGRIMNRVAKIASSNISVMDRANRIGVWLAAYRMAKDPATLKAWNKVWFGNQLYREAVAAGGLTPDTLARFMVDEAIGVWGRKNQPMMQRRVPLLFQFHGFQMRVLSAIFRNNRMGKEGRIANLFLAAAIMAFAGALGIPFAQDLIQGIEGLARLFGQPDPMLEGQLYDLMQDSYFNHTATDAILKGPARQYLGVDLSTRLGFGNIAPDLQLNPYAMLGAVPSIIAMTAQQVAERHMGDQTYGQFSPLMPAALRNPYNAFVVYPNEGVRTARENPNDPGVVEPSELTTADQIKRALGYQPTTVANAYEDRIYQQRLAAASREASHNERMEGSGKPRRYIPPENRVPRKDRRPSPYLP